MWLVTFVARALVELAIGRVIFSRLTTKQIAEKNGLGAHDAHKNVELTAKQSQLVDRISFILPRLASRLPWRADCLVQAIAAQRWLHSVGLDSEIVIGVEKPEDSKFGAHAWLTCAGKIVTGGDVARYEPILQANKH